MIQMLMTGHFSFEVLMPIELCYVTRDYFEKFTCALPVIGISGFGRS